MGNFYLNLDGLVVGLNCQEPRQCQIIRDLWVRLYVLEDEPSQSPDIIYQFKSPGEKIDTNSEVSEIISESPHITVLKTHSGNILHCGTSKLVVDIENGKCIGVLNKDFLGQPLEYQREFFLLSFLMLLQYKNRYGLHANVIARENAGYIIAGPAGSGKTSLTLGMVLLGWKFLSDDANILYETAHGVYVHALRRGLSCTPESLAHYPELRAAADESPELSEGKKLIDIESLLPKSFTTQCSPRVLLFPEISTGSTSQLISISETEAMIALVEQSPGIMTDRQMVQEQMGVLKSLLQQTRHYRLLLANDLFDSPEMLSSLLHSIPIQ